MTNFTQGQTVYDIHGRAGSYVARAALGHIVEPLHESDDWDEPRHSEAQTWREVFAKPPTAKLHAEVAAIELRLHAARAALDQVREEQRVFEADEKARLARLKQHAALARIDEFIAGKFGLFVRFPEYGEPTIVDAEEALNSVDREVYSSRGKKLLVLFGEAKGDLAWRINEYRDGSGSRWDEHFPIETEAEGIAEIRRRYAAAVDEWRARTEDRKHYGAAISWAAGKLPTGWIDVPADVQAYIDAKRRESARSAYDKALLALTAAEEQLRLVGANT